MVEGKLYKTKLCALYQRGRCTRQYCNFAHGNAELRGSFNERRDYRGGRDLRERLDRRHSPSHNSLGRGDARATTYSSRGDSPQSGKRMDANHRKRKQTDAHSDQSERFSDESDEQAKDRRHSSSDAQMRINEKLREMQSEIKMEEAKKRQLEIYLEGRSKEVDTLSLNIHELEVQLSKEKEESKRSTTKIKKFIKAHHRYLRSQDELKRSQSQFQKLAEQLELDIAGSIIDDGPKINAFMDNVRSVRGVSPLNDSQMNLSPMHRRARIHLDYDASNQMSSVGERIETGKHRLESISRHSDQFKSNRIPEPDYDAYNGNGSLAQEIKSNRESQLPPDSASTGKYKAYETATVPSTGIAAHALEEVDIVESDKLPVNGATPETEVPLKTPSLPFLPQLPPPVTENAYAQYKGEEETVDIDGVDEEMVEVDIV